MGKPAAEAFSMAGDRYLGRTYQEMDCQAFVERCLADVGIIEDLRGSNAWMREMTWTGSPEECRKMFGEIPRGAFLFILARDGGEEKRGYHDGRGNASHIGIYTGRGVGAIHSSASRGCVAVSVFTGKTIRGGWNLVGLWDRLSYGEKIDRMLAGGSEEKQEDKMQKAQVFSANGQPVKMRASTRGGTAGYRLYDELPVGTSVEVVERGDKWSQVNYGSRRGWYIQSQFLVFGEYKPEPGEAQEDSGQNPETETEMIAVAREELEKIYDVIGDWLGKRG